MTAEQTPFERMQSLIWRLNKDWDKIFQGYRADRRREPTLRQLQKLVNRMVDDA